MRMPLGGCRPWPQERATAIFTVGHPQMPNTIGFHKLSCSFPPLCPARGFRIAWKTYLKREVLGGLTSHPPPSCSGPGISGTGSPLASSVPSDPGWFWGSRAARLEGDKGLVELGPFSFSLGVTRLMLAEPAAGPWAKTYAGMWR